MSCTPKCWTPVPCPVCGNSLPPRGRSVAMAMNPPQCCMEQQNTAINTRHMWSEHDSDRHYFDPEGWAEHVQDCEECQ